MQVRINNLYRIISDNIFCFYLFLPAGFNINLLRNFRIRLQDNILYIENYLRDIFQNSLHGGKFMISTFYFYSGDCCALNRRKQNPPQRIAKSNTIPSFERFGDKLAVIRCIRILLNNNLLGKLKISPFYPHIFTSSPKQHYQTKIQS